MVEQVDRESGVDETMLVVSDLRVLAILQFEVGASASIKDWHKHLPRLVD